MLIGRENEIATLHGLMSSDESQFVAVYGRRRVGKTFLIREASTRVISFSSIPAHTEPLAGSS